MQFSPLITAMSWTCPQYLWESNLVIVLGALNGVFPFCYSTLVFSSLVQGNDQIGAKIHFNPSFRSFYFTGSVEA